MVIEGNWIVQFLAENFPERNWGVVEIPERLAILADREKVAIQLPADEAAFKAWLK